MLLSKPNLFERLCIVLLMSVIIFIKYYIAMLFSIIILKLLKLLSLWLVPKFVSIINLIVGTTTIMFLLLGLIHYLFCKDTEIARVYNYSTCKSLLITNVGLVLGLFYYFD